MRRRERTGALAEASPDNVKGYDAQGDDDQVEEVVDGGVEGFEVVVALAKQVEDELTREEQLSDLRVVSVRCRVESVRCKEGV